MSEEAETYASCHGLPYLEVSSKENGPRSESLNNAIILTVATMV